MTPTSGEAPLTYKSSGVDLDAAIDVKSHIADLVSASHGPGVLEGIGSFGAMYQLGEYREPILVSSTDGVGTKLKIASMIGRFDTIGKDLVNLCVNDIIVTGARPLFFLDYIAVSSLKPNLVDDIVKGMVEACKAVGCALIGGETAQMPGVYDDGELDLAGFVVGALEKNSIKDLSRIKESDLLVGIPSSGLHTNGYSLVRHALQIDDNPSILEEYFEEIDGPLGDALLVPHRSYYNTLAPLFSVFKAAAHITGGGLPENIPRVLTKDLSARIDTTTWDRPPIMPLIQNMGNISLEEMYRVFNMGLGMVLVCEPSAADEAIKEISGACIIGEIIKTEEGKRVSLI
ncbi:MAG: phosphoribosylformylglycinamidine cyclo-ligase [Chloroflexota bacterium]|nr:phosphoribosylformylglycinamidine cyclo-ligase [Chloroflexota bacterium]